MGRKVIKETSTTETVTRRGGSGYGTSGLISSSGIGGGNMSRKVILETTTTTTKSGYGGKSGSGYGVESVSLAKSGNEKDWRSSGSSLAYRGASKTTKTTGGKKAWDLEIGTGDEVFTGRHPSDEEVSSGGNGYSKFSSKREVKLPSYSKGATTTTVKKYSMSRTSKGY